MKWRCDECAQVYRSEPDECNGCDATSFHTVEPHILFQWLDWKVIILTLLLYLGSNPSGGGLARALGALAGLFVVSYILVKAGGIFYSLSKKAILRVAYPAEYN